MTKGFDVKVSTPFMLNMSLLLVILSVSACVTTPEKTADNGVAAESTTDPSAAAETAVASNAGVKSADTGGSYEPMAGKKEEVSSEPLRIVESCKSEPYVKLEEQAKASLEKGLAATKAGKFGVGFRNEMDYKRWKGIHTDLFKKVNEYCNSLKQCAQKHPKDKDSKCSAEAYVYNEWSKIAEHFAKEAETLEITEPDPVCSAAPNLADEPGCFLGLGDNFEKFCSTGECKEVSDCWRGVGYLDQAIKQAAQACRFVHQELSGCRGYQEATNRRESKFNRCKAMQEELSMPVFPAM